MEDHGRKWTDIYTWRLEKRIREIYEEAQRDIDKKMADFQKNRLIKMKIQHEKLLKGEITQEEYGNWLKGQVFQGQQWETKKRQIIGVISNANAIATKIANEQRGNVFVENSNYQAYLLEHGAGINFGFGLYDSSSVVRLVRNRENGTILPMWKVNEPKDYTWNSKVVSNAITQGIIQGERLDRIAARLSDGLCTKNRNKMLTFARTGMTQAQNAGRLDRLGEAQKMGIKVHKEWMATLDERTRTMHQMLDGKKVPINKPFRVDNYEIDYPGDPAAHPAMVYNCRCTLVGDLDDYPSEYERYDNINGKPIANMTYQQWMDEKNGVVRPEFTQAGIKRCKTVKEVNDLLNTNNLFNGGRADLTGCDLESAKAVASSYEQVFSRYPTLKGRFDPPNAQPVNMGHNTYAWCYTRTGGRVQVNPDRFNNWNELKKAYESDVMSNWHPRGTTAECIVIHELGHAIDGLLANEGVLGGYTASGQFKYASSTLKNTVMKRAAKKDSDLADLMQLDKWLNDESATLNYVSEYATKNNKEWFAECFAEYMTSDNPRLVASEFGKALEKLIAKLN